MHSCFINWQCRVAFPFFVRPFHMAVTICNNMFHRRVARSFYPASILIILKCIILQQSTIVALVWQFQQFVVALLILALMVLPDSAIAAIRVRCGASASAMPRRRAVPIWIGLYIRQTIPNAPVQALGAGRRRRRTLRDGCLHA